MQTFQLVAEAIDTIPMLHYAKVSGGVEQKVRTGAEPCGPWFECPQIRALVLDVGRRLDAVGVGEVVLFPVTPGEEHQLLLAGDPDLPGTHYYFVTVGAAPGVTATTGPETIPVIQGSIWWNKVLPKFVNNSVDELWVLAFVLRLDV